MNRSRLATAVLALCLCSARSQLGGQQPAGVDISHEVVAGGDLENYLRYLQAMSRAEDYPWSIRPFSSAQLHDVLRNTTAHPWQQRFEVTAPAHGFAEFGVIAPKATVFFNSAFPYGSDDGPVWAGRGLTYQLQGGVFMRAGPLTLVLAPVAFRAENTSFQLFDTAACPPSCGISSNVDLPQRFGDRPYQRLDPGSSSIELTTPIVSAGLSTANEWWGPAQYYPYILSNNAPGFLHLFFQTARPMPILIGRLHARVIYGKLDQSPYSSVTGSARYVTPLETGRVRFAAGLLTVFEPRGLDGLELGVGRFFHFVWPRLGIPPSFVRKPFGVLFRSNTGPTGVDENQLGSVFARWVFPRSGMEVYGEYGREDNSYDKRDLLQEPDHSRSYMLGFRKSYHAGAEGFSAIHGELINFQTPGLLREGRGEGTTYTHSFLKQGHTNVGQLLGAPVGFNSAAGSVLGWERFNQSGHTAVTWERRLRREKGTFSSNSVVNPKSMDVWHALHIERTKFLGAFDVTGGATIVKEFNRDFRDDAWNFNTVLSAQYRLP
jgi:hypothetical protein